MKQQQAHNGMWLYNDNQFRRVFASEVCLPDNAPLWPECTDAEKQDWESKHPEPQPEQQPETDFEGVRIHRGNTDKDTEGCIFPEQ